MKRTLQSISLLVMGALVLSACTEEKTGKSPEKIVEKIDVNSEKVAQDTVPPDTVVVEEPIAPPPPPPLPPDPWPEPYPEPWPPEPIPEPIPEPVPPPPPGPAPIPIVDFPDVAPIFPGDTPQDQKNLFKFISENVKYPEVDKEMGNQGRVYVEFIVEKDGSLSNVKVLRGVSKTIDAEAKRVIRSMPNWIPGESGGKIVRTKTRLPISFVMD